MQMYRNWCWPVPQVILQNKNLPKNWFEENNIGHLKKEQEKPATKTTKNGCWEKNCFGHWKRKKEILFTAPKKEFMARKKRLPKNSKASEHWHACDGLNFWRLVHRKYCDNEFNEILLNIAFNWIGLLGYMLCSLNRYHFNA